MVAVETNTIQIAQADTPNGGSIDDFKLIDLREITRFFNESTQEQAQNISRNRLDLKSKTTATTSGVGYGSYFGHDVFNAVARELFFAKLQNEDANKVETTAAITSNDSYTIGAASADLAALVGINTLVWARGFTNSSNNGLKVVDANLAANATSIGVTENLTDESNATGTLSIAGYRIGSGTAKTYTYDQTNSLGTLASVGIGNAPGLQRGMFIYVGSIASTGGAVQNAFRDRAVNDVYGVARIRTINTDSLVLDELGANLKEDGTATGTAVDLVYGTFVTNVSVDSTDYIRGVRTYEQVLPGLSAAGTDSYRYSDGNIIDALTLAIPTDAYVTSSVTTRGTLTSQPTTTRRPDFVTAANNGDIEEPSLRDTLVTGRDIARVRFAGDSDGYEVTVFNMDWTLTNNLSNKNAVAVEGSWRINAANFTAAITMNVSMSDSNFEGILLGETPVSITSVFQNTDGVIIPHIPSMTISRTGETYTLGDVVEVAGSARAFEDPVFGTGASFSIWPVPFTRAQL